MENFILRARLSAIMDQPDGQRTLYDYCSFKFTFWSTVPINPRCISLCGTLDQIRRAFSCARFHRIFSLRSHGASENSSVPIPDGRRGALSVLPAAIVYFGVHRVWLGLPHRSSGINIVDHVVLSVFPRRRCADINDRRGTDRRLHISLHYFTPAGLCAAHGRDCALHRVSNRDVRDAQGGLVRARRELRLSHRAGFCSVDRRTAFLYHARSTAPTMAEFTVNPKRFDP